VTSVRGARLAETSETKAGWYNQPIGCSAHGGGTHRLYSKKGRKKKVQAPCNRPEGPEGVRSIALLFLDFGTRRGGWPAPRPECFTAGKDPVPIVQEAGWAPGPVWTCAKNLAPTGIRIPDRPARNQSLYRLSYPDPHFMYYSQLLSGHGNEM
jgi:hypothetical protein